METKHTPLPWNVDFHRGIFFITEPNNNRAIAKLATIDGISRANAEFIVRAVNSHYELLEQIKSYLTHAKEMSDDPADAWAEKVRKLENLISKAGGAK